MRFIAFLLLMAASASGQETYRVATNLVNVAFSVRDSKGTLVENQDGLVVRTKTGYFAR